MKMRFLLAGAFALSTASTLVQAEDKTLTIGTNNWAENIAVANMWKILLEEAADYDVELTNVSKSMLYSGMANGDIDLSLEIWLPITDKPFLEPYKDRLEVHDTWYAGTGLGLVVPSYVDIDTIPELEAHADEFEYQSKSTILGIGTGSAIAGLTDDAIDAYGLPQEQMNSSEAAMMSALDNAYSAHQAIVVTLWNPHWAFAQYDLKYLDDPKNVYGDSENIHWFSHEGFAQGNPWLTAVLNAWEMDDETLGGLMATIEETGDPVEGARQWIDGHQALVDSWLQAGKKDKT